MARKATRSKKRARPKTQKKQMKKTKLNLRKKAATRRKVSARKPKRSAARRPARRGRPPANLRDVSAIMHDITNQATAMRAYLELLESQGSFEARQKYYLDRTKEQVDLMVTTVQDLRTKLPSH